MADDRLPCCRSESIAATRSDNVMSRPPAISLSPFQNASSRLTLVLWPAITMDRLTTGDFITRLLFRSGGDRGRDGLNLAFGFEFALGFAASVQHSIGRCRSFGALPFRALARAAKVNDVAHPTLDDSLRGLRSLCVASEPNAPIAWRAAVPWVPASRARQVQDLRLSCETEPWRPHSANSIV